MRLTENDFPVEYSPEDINSMIADLRERNISTKSISDTYHTFGDLYNDRSVLFQVITSIYPDLSWKSKLHHDDTMFDGMFIVGIDTPEGQFTYHYNMREWDLYNVKILDKAPEWDGHTSKDITRLLSLVSNLVMKEKL